MRRVAESVVRHWGKVGPIFMYRPFEKQRNAELMAMFPNLAEPLRALRDPLVDLHPIAKHHYYHPYMKGS